MLRSAYLSMPLVILAAAQPFQATASEIFRCVDKSGHTVFQQHPCEPNEPPNAASKRAASSPSSLPTSPPSQHSLTNSTSSCPRLADAIRQIGRGYQANQSETELRAQLAARYQASELNIAFAAFQLGRSVPAEDLALFSQLICETQSPLPPPQIWQQKKNEAEIKLQGWQQRWQWPSSWRLTGIREQPDVQIALAYADFDSMQLRIGCRAHNSGDRLRGLGHQLLALWAEQIQPGANERWRAGHSHPATFGNNHGKDFESGRELFTATLPEYANNGLHMGPVSAPQVSVALTSQRLCIAARTGEAVDFNVTREASSLVEILLTSKPSPFK